MVAKGYSQVPGLDFEDTFSPVVKMPTLRILVALAAAHDYELEQLDVKTAFLYGQLQEEIYMQVPRGISFPVTSSPTVCRLKKSIYGLKQSPRAWFSRIDTFLKSLGYASLHLDGNVYIKREGKRLLVLAIYVDDIVIMHNSPTMVTTLKGQLSAEFKITSGGQLAFCLGLQFLRNRAQGTIFMHQFKYSKQILERYGMQDAKPISTPMEQNLKLTAHVGDVPDEDLELVAAYPSENGSLMHLMVESRPDLGFTVGTHSQFLSNPSRAHSNAMKRTYRYVKGTADWGLLYDKHAKDALTLLTYSDADWAGDADGRRSISSYVCILAGAAVSWSSRRQPTIALSSTEAEYKSLTDACKEII